jgi:hypothetical protein
MRTREEFLALTGRRDFAPRSLDPAFEAKLARILAVKEKRDTLNRARLIAERVVTALERQRDRQRLLGGGGESYLLGEALMLRAELYSLDL